MRATFIIIYFHYLFNFAQPVSTTPRNERHCRPAKTSSSAAGHLRQEMCGASCDYHAYARAEPTPRASTARTRHRMPSRRRRNSLSMRDDRARRREASHWRPTPRAASAAGRSQQPCIAEHRWRARNATAVIIERSAAVAIAPITTRIKTRTAKLYAARRAAAALPHAPRAVSSHQPPSPPRRQIDAFTVIVVMIIGQHAAA